MKDYRIEKVAHGYIIHQIGDEVPGKWGLYLTSISKNGYKWSYDYTYARTMTLKTAAKHLKAISKEART